VNSSRLAQPECIATDLRLRIHQRYQQRHFFPVGPATVAGGLLLQGPVNANRAAMFTRMRA